MEKLYEELELEVIRFQTEDIITTSAAEQKEEETPPDETPEDPVAPPMK